MKKKFEIKKKTQNQQLRPFNKYRKQKTHTNNTLELVWILFGSTSFWSQQKKNYFFTSVVVVASVATLAECETT